MLGCDSANGTRHVHQGYGESAWAQFPMGQHVRKFFIERGLSTVSENFGGRRTANMSIAEEEAFLDSFKDRAKSGGVLEVSEIHVGLEKILSRKVHRSAVYKLLHRHGWRKLAPRKRNTKSEPLAQEA